jgi:uncharacterized protein (DUF736 family)
MQIGTFRATADGYAGRLICLTLDVELTLVPAEHSDADNAPDYRVMRSSGDDAHEVGAGWNKVGERAGDYVAVQIDDPSFVQPLRANLFQADPTTHILLWNRPPRRDEKS